MRSILTNDKPIGVGRCGDLVAKTPVRMPFRRGGATLARVCVVSFLWKWNNILHKTRIIKTKGNFQILLTTCANIPVILRGHDLDW